MFGDRIEDMQAAVSAGVTGIGITQTVRDMETLKAAGASETFSEFRLIRKFKVLFPD